MSILTKRDGLVRWIPVFGIMGLIYLFSSIPGPSFLQIFGSFDFLLSKSGHTLIYAALSISLYYALVGSISPVIALAWSVAVLFAITDEYHQLLVPGRGPWFVDVIIDGFGAALGLVVVHYLRNLQIRGPFHPRD